MILDGWGKTIDPSVSAIEKAHTPFMDAAYNTFPNATLQTSGLSVGLPSGQMGNSEVGHINLGAGRVVYQNLAKINMATEAGTLMQEPVLQDAISYAKTNNKKIHLLGLISDGGVHSHVDHLKAILSGLHQSGLSDVYLHAFTDGRDCDPKSSTGFVVDLLDHMKKTTGKFASVIGRYYAMDRDKRWERVKTAYDLLVNGEGEEILEQDLVSRIEGFYQQEITDEFLPAMSIIRSGEPKITIQSDDVVFCFNFRTDRCREITQVLSQEDFPEFGMKKLPLYFVTMTQYSEHFTNVHAVFKEDKLSNTLGEVLSKAGKKQIRIAETEKYPWCRCRGGANERSRRHF
ncbi:MAG: phosphoglycerate mutase (2,3-diphosphoglycerate-independent) [Flavobacteriaceae bacterium]|nr:MAG: phosphoglycerate mutase (2,3-diphosphoglycerate-independent) [Flavobacteriaceae bacterium]